MTHRRPGVRAIGMLLATTLLLIVAGCGRGGGAPGAGVTVAAASDLRDAFEDLAGAFSDETGIEVTFSFGSSGMLREQAINGAPFDVFASADERYVDDVLTAGIGDPRTKAAYGRGRLVLWPAPGLVAPAQVDGLRDPRYERIAIANPEHAPYGRAALEALTAAGIEDELEDRLVYGENISDTLRLVQSGNADVGIVALSLVISEEDDPTLVPEQLHQPLDQALVVTAAGERAAPARAFAAYVNSPAGREIMLRYGFALPGEVPPARDG